MIGVDLGDWDLVSDISTNGGAPAPAAKTDGIAGSPPRRRETEPQRWPRGRSTRSRAASAC